MSGTSATDWRAVGFGFAVSLVLGVVGFALPVIGHAAAGLVAGFVAGYLAGGGLLSGFWHGLLAGSIGGIVLAVLAGVFSTVLLTVDIGPPGLFGGVGVFFIALAVAIVFALDSAVAGAAAGWFVER